jgi:UDP-N-acetylmuramoyl-L-alanyl-D-glutamate--2,6-diaminopimelate ligase
MLYKLKKFIRGLVPAGVLIGYHASVNWIAQLFAGFPARTMITIGVTGTEGKTSTVSYISNLLVTAGFKTGFTSTATFKVGPRVTMNPMKMTMPGRFSLARLLLRIKKSGARYLIVENTSEGLRQHRHAGIAYDVAVFTNLSPEHIESHGSFENYRKAKEMLFASLAHAHRKPGVKKIIIANLDDAHAKHFLSYDADEKWGFTLEGAGSHEVTHVVRPAEYSCGPTGIEFVLTDKAGNAVRISTGLVGIFNLKNMLAAAAVALSQGVTLEKVKEGLEKLEPVPGRMEPISEGQPFTVIVDYAHAPSSLKLVYSTLREQLAPGKKLIAVLGSAGGGRDKGKRPVMGELAARLVDFSVVTNEDPYDEDPAEIIQQVAQGFVNAGKKKGEDYVEVLDRREGIRWALDKARPGDVVVITGKGCEAVIMSKDGKRIPHDDRTVAREIIGELQRAKR